jgi:hypothetical protein
MKNLLKNMAILSIAMIFFGCSKDETPTSTANYSILGMWTTTSSVLNGVEQFGGSNTVKTELTVFWSIGGRVETYSYSDLNATNLYRRSNGTYTKSSNNLNMTANVYNSSNVLLQSNFSTSSEIILLSATELQIKTLNYPSPNDVYIKKYIRS